MATIQLALSGYKFKTNKHVHARSFVDTVAGFIHNAFTAEGQTPQKPRRGSESNTVSSLRKESPLKNLDANTHISLLQACNNMKELKQVHAHMLVTGLEQNILLITKLVNLYVTYGSLQNARQVFDEISERNVFSWNAMIGGYARNGPCEEVLTLFYQMQRASIQPDSFTFPFLLKACGSLSALQEGKKIHCLIIGYGFELDVIVGTALIDMYAKCRSTCYARQMFDRMSERDVVSWNAMIAGYAQNGHAYEALNLFWEMQLAGMEPNSVTLLSVLPSCSHLAALQQGKWIHAYAIRSGFDSCVSVGKALIDMYAKCKSIDVARLLFDKMPKRDPVTWSGMITGYAQNGYANDALILFRQMQLADVKPDLVTLVSALLACADLECLQRGKGAHCYVIKNGFVSDVSVETTLVTMYSRCGSIEVARQLFDKMFNRDVVSWSAMIAGYAQKGYASEALTLFYQMQLENLEPNRVTIASVLPACADLDDLQRGYAQNGYANEALILFHRMQQADVQPDLVTMVSVLPACAHLAALQEGKWVHDYINQNGFGSDVSVANALIDMYAKCGSIEVAVQLFEKISKRDVVSWNAMIAGYTQNGLANEALMLFHQMQMMNVPPNLITTVSVLPACAHLAALQEGKWIHAYIIRSGFESDVFVGNALIDMYTKCGSIEAARQLFDIMSERDVISWNTVIAGYGIHGQGKDALELFVQMQQSGTKPDHITFTCALSACRHSGLVEEGWQCFVCMSQDHCITPRVEHYACMVDLLGRAGRLDEAQDFIKKMPLEPDASVWGALLGACRIHYNIKLGECVSKRLLELEPKNSGHYILLSNIYAGAGRWNDAAKVRTMLKDRGLKKIPGCSWIEIKNRVHAFLVGDTSHPQSEKIYAMLESLAGQMKQAGYVPDKSFVLHNVEEEEKENMLSSHSEKLAIAFGLINTIPGTSIRITKNLRVCGDCHSAAKFISKIVRREITVRDTNRFHHFKDGLCSCGDYW